MKKSRRVIKGLAKGCHVEWVVKAVRPLSLERRDDPLDASPLQLLVQYRRNLRAQLGLKLGGFPLKTEW